jgi:hypothetical protein
MAICIRVNALDIHTKQTIFCTTFIVSDPVQPSRLQLLMYIYLFVGNQIVLLVPFDQLWAEYFLREQWLIYRIGKCINGFEKIRRQRQNLVTARVSPSAQPFRS